MHQRVRFVDLYLRPVGPDRVGGILRTGERSVVEIGKLPKRNDQIGSAWIGSESEGGLVEGARDRTAISRSGGVRFAFAGAPAIFWIPGGYSDAGTGREDRPAPLLGLGVIDNPLHHPASIGW